MLPAGASAAFLCLWLGSPGHVLCMPPSQPADTIITTNTLGGRGDGRNSHEGTHPSYPPVSSQPASVIPKCEPPKIKVIVDEDPVFDYRLETHPNTCKGDDDSLVTLYICDGGFWAEFDYEGDGSYCVMDKGSYKLEYKNVQSDCFDLSGFMLHHTDVSFVNNTEARVVFQKLPHWLKELTVTLVYGNENDIAGSTTTTEREIVIPGTYPLNETFYLWYKPVINKSMKGDCHLHEKWSSPGYINKEQEKQRLVNPDNTVVRAAILGVLCVAVLGAVAVSILYCFCKGRTNPSPYPEKPQSLLPDVDNKCVGEVLLVHAEDTTSLARLCQDLKAAVIKHCGRKVLDITLSDAQRLKSPETWLLNVLSNEENTVLLVMSPAMAALHKTLQQDSTAAGSVALAAVRGKMHHWDELLPICFQYLCQNLSQNYRRLCVVKFEQESTNEEDISELVPAKRYLLPKHQQELLTALGSHHV